MIERTLPQLILNRTIHGMVYNAMKLFMEINPQLFDDCSHDYTQRQSTAEQREQMRQKKWDRLEQQAQLRRNSQSAIPSSITPRGLKINPPPRIDEVDPITQDSQKRLDALRLQDESGGMRDQQRPWEGGRANQVSDSHCPRTGSRSPFVACKCIAKSS